MKECPRCKRPCLDEDRAMNALSHIDNKTQICSKCGQMEGYIGLAEKGIPSVNITSYEISMHDEFVKSLKVSKTKDRKSLP